MKLAAKIVAVCLVAMMLITALSSYLIARREFQRVRERQQSDVTRVGNIIRESVDLAYSKDGHQGIVSAIKTQTIESNAATYRWVWLDVTVNDPTHPAAPLDAMKQILAGKTDSVIATHDGKNQLHTYFPIDVNDASKGAKRKGAIEVSDSLESAEEEAWRTIKTGLIAMAGMVLFCLAFVGWAGVHLVGRPLAKLVDHTRKIGDGAVYEPLAVESKDEIGQLAAAMNSMSTRLTEQQKKIESESNARIATMQQLRHADRLKTVGRLAAGVSHEIGTPLNVVSGRAGLIRSGKLSPQELEESAAAIQSESNRIAGIVRQLLDFARHNPPQRASVDLRIVLERTISLLKTLTEKNKVEIESSFDGDPPFTAFVDESQIQQVLTNLIVNATQAMPNGGKIDLRLANVEVDSTAFVQIEIQDQGTGMEDATLNQIFEPFFTTKEVGQGTGLGLSIAHGMIEEHGGTIEVESEPGVGSTFRVLLSKSET